MFKELAYISDRGERRALLRKAGRAALPASRILIYCLVTVGIGFPVGLFSVRFAFSRMGHGLPIAVAVVTVVMFVAFWVTLQRIVRRPVQRQIRRLLRERGITLCIECGYDLRAHTGGRCPECGLANTDS
jgi:hypothetical protein